MLRAGHYQGLLKKNKLTTAKCDIGNKCCSTHFKQETLLVVLSIGISEIMNICTIFVAENQSCLLPHNYKSMILKTPMFIIHNCRLKQRTLKSANQSGGTKIRLEISILKREKCHFEKKTSFKLRE